MGTPQRSASKSEPEQAPRSRRARRRPRRKNVVLIADDAQDTRDIYTVFLESRGFRAVTARDGAEAVALATSLQPDVIIMDLAMPQFDGISATRRLKRDPKTGGIPVILLTGYSHIATDRHVLEAGVDVFLRKPCLPEHLEHHVRRLLDRRAERS